MDNQLIKTLLGNVHCDKYDLYSSCGQASGLDSFPSFFTQYSFLFKRTIQDYLINPDKYVFLYKTIVNGKIRQIITYQATPEGQMLRHFHRLFALALGGVYEPDAKSFAYQKGKSTDSCLKLHLRSDTYLKTDIHSYFDSVSFDLLFDRLMTVHSWPKSRTALLKKFLSTCFYKGHLPIGFVTSPILSDIFLKDLDERMSMLKGICYTRYADDFIISTTGVDAKEKLEQALEILRAEITNHKLELNKKKTYIRQLKTEGDAIHLLGLNMVKTSTRKNRITVSHRYIIETSKEIGYLLQNKTNIELWEMRRQFASVMGKVSFITHASKDSAAKLKKLLQIKTGYKGSLTYKALSRLLLDDVSVLQEYEQEKQLETYVRIKHFKVLPATARCWERVTIPADSIKDRSALRHHLFSICREFENESGRLSINRMKLTVGQESLSFEYPWNTELFRSLIRKIRTESTEVSYSSDYQFDNGQPDKLTKCGEYHYTTKNWFRPLIAQRSIGSFILYSAQENRWIFRQDLSTPPQRKQVLETAYLPEISEQTEWEGSISIDLRWPFQLDEDISKKIDALYSQIKDHLSPWWKDNTAHHESRCLQAEQISIKADAQKLMAILDSLQELFSLVKQSNGFSIVNAWFVPVGFLESTKETRLRYICVSTLNGKFTLQKFEG